jgi:cytochrome c biogenesis protein CcmG/thiol:disulfide interchange protein DsbE
MQSGMLERLLNGAIVLLVVALLWVVSGSFRERLVVVGDTAPDFSVVADNGKSIRPKDFGGKLLLLNFWATWCPPCVDEMPSLEQLHRTLGPKGLVVFGLSVDKDEQVYRRFLERTKISFPTARDNGQRINLEYGTVKFPETYIINREGKVLRKIISSRDWMAPSILADLESLL